MSKSADGEENPLSMGLIEHLVELRDRLLRMVIAVVICFAVLFPFSSELYSWLSGPLTAKLPVGSSMIAIDVASPFLAPFKLVMMLSVFLAIPVLLYQLWGFVAPGLYKHEKRLAFPLLVSSVVLFYVGIAFAYYVVFPLVFGFFTSVAPDGVAVMTDINRYLDFVMMLFFAFGLAFEVPVATIILVALGITTTDKLSSMRPYVVVGAFVIGMFLTPPDVISQTLLAVPMWILFELGLIFARILIKDRDDTDAQSAAAAGATINEVPRPFEGPQVTMEPERAADRASPSDDALATDGQPERTAPLSDEEMDAELARMEADEKVLNNETHENDVENEKPPGHQA